LLFRGFLYFIIAIIVYSEDFIYKNIEINYAKNHAESRGFNLQSLFNINDLELSSLTTFSIINTKALPRNLQTGYSVLFANIALKTDDFYGLYFGTRFSALGRIANFNDKRASFSPTPRIYSFLINNDEAKDVLFTSDNAHLPEFFLHFQTNSNAFGLNIGRFGGDYEWIGDYLEGAEIYANKGKMRFALGGFYRQSYANPQENTRYGYIKKLYEEQQGYDMSMNYYVDAHYVSNNSYFRGYANYIHSLYAALGIKGYGRYDISLSKKPSKKSVKNDTSDNVLESSVELKSSNVASIGGAFDVVYVSAGIQNGSYCANPSIAFEAGLNCYKKGSFGKINGVLIRLDGHIDYKNLKVFVGYIGNIKAGATDLLPVYADNNPLEYNTFIYGERGQSGYVRLEYKFKYVSGFVGYARTMFFSPQKSFSNQILGEIQTHLKYINIHLTITYIDEVNYSSAIISKLWVGYRF